MTPLRNVRLFGQLGKRFGRVHRMAVEDTAEAIRALCRMKPGFEAYMMQSGDNGVDFQVRVGKRALTLEELRMKAGADICIVPVLRGAKNGGIVGILLGTALIVASFFIPGSTAFAAALLNAGVAMALGGVVQLLSPPPKDPKSKDKAENEPNYAFNGPVNTQAQGNCVPVLYGDGWMGSAVISAGINVGDAVYIPATETVYDPDPIPALGPSFDYHMEVLPEVPDQSGNGRDDLSTYGVLPSNIPALGGIGVQFNQYARLQSNDGGGLLNVHPTHTVIVPFVIDNFALGGTTTMRNILGAYSNAILLDCNWALQLRGPNRRTPTLVFNNLAGGGPVITAGSEVVAGAFCTIGFRHNGTLWELLFNGLPVPGGSLVDAVNSSFGAAGLYINGLSSGANWELYGWPGSVGRAVGFNTALTDAQILNLHNWLEDRNAVLVEHGEGDDWLEEETE